MQFVGSEGRRHQTQSSRLFFVDHDHYCLGSEAADMKQGRHSTLSSLKNHRDKLEEPSSISDYRLPMIIKTSEEVLLFAQSLVDMSNLPLKSAMCLSKTSWLVRSCLLID